MITAFRKTAETFAAGAKTLEQKYFVSPQIFAEEQQKIFSRQWVLVGHQSRIAQAGDYFTAEIAGESLIVVRDKRDAIRGRSEERRVGKDGKSRRAADKIKTDSAI